MERNRERGEERVRRDGEKQREGRGKSKEGGKQAKTAGQNTRWGLGLEQGGGGGGGRDRVGKQVEGRSKQVGKQ